MNPKPNVSAGAGQAPQRRGRGGTAPARKQRPEERNILDEERGEDEVEAEHDEQDEDDEDDDR
jgi:hypothetical protein